MAPTRPKKAVFQNYRFLYWILWPSQGDPPGKLMHGGRGPPDEQTSIDGF